jgi:hypothetical protein
VVVGVGFCEPVAAADDEPEVEEGDEEEDEADELAGEVAGEPVDDDGLPLAGFVASVLPLPPVPDVPDVPGVAVVLVAPDVPVAVAARVSAFVCSSRSSCIRQLPSKIAPCSMTSAGVWMLPLTLATRPSSIRFEAITSPLTVP